MDRNTLSGALNSFKTAVDALIAWVNKVSKIKIPTFKWENGAWIPSVSDFISRPGQPITAISPQDTVIGTKTPETLGGGGGGGDTYNFYNTINGVTMDKNGMADLAKQLAQYSRSEFRRKSASGMIR